MRISDWSSDVCSSDLLLENIGESMSTAFAPNGFYDKRCRFLDRSRSLRIPKLHFDVEPGLAYTGAHLKLSQRRQGILRPCSHVDQGSISLRRFQQCVYAIPVRVYDDIPLAVEVGKYPLVELGAPAPDHAPEGRDDRQRYDRQIGRAHV